MKSLALKSLIVTAAFAATSAFGAGNGLPFEKAQFDRALPNVPQRTVASGERVLIASSDQGRATDARHASGGASSVTSRSTFATGVWANDHGFIAPAQ
jgi:hypothetical protein